MTFPHFNGQPNKGIMPGREVRDGTRTKEVTREFKQEAVKLVKGGQSSIHEVAKDLDLVDSVLRRWVKRYDIDHGRGAPSDLTTEERKELRKLRRENTRLRMEREFLKKAVAFFAKENQ